MEKKNNKSIVKRKIVWKPPWVSWLSFSMWFIVVHRLLDLHSEKQNTQRERLHKKKRDKKFYELFYLQKSFISLEIFNFSLQKSCISLEIFNFNFAVMPGENCAFVGCSSNCRHKQVSLFKLPTVKDETTKNWRREMLNVITRDRVVEENFKKQTEKDRVYVSKKYFRECDMYLLALAR